MAENKGRIVKRGVINQRYKYTISDDGVVTIMGTGVLDFSRNRRLCICPLLFSKGSYST